MITEDQLEQLALTWFQDAGWDYRHGPDIAPDGDAPERADYRQVLLQGRLHEAAVLDQSLGAIKAEDEDRE
ncbi:type I restriction endonuclease [Halothiobacillus sp.]|jgi:type I restriction enzyme R subunit|uniref:type I restriction endonuclease n=1 Tax=Halothiobacillus sp. TaxID=1891311 RepID=UPI002AD362D6|nr:type I restriction endonuclease [Halothiobacillus sp.]